MGNEDKDDPSKDFSTVHGTRTGHEACMLSDDDESRSDFVVSLMGTAHVKVSHDIAVDSIVK